MSIEIELRYEVLKPEELPLFLAPFKKLHSGRDIDVYLDTVDANLYKKGIFIRTRNYKKLDIKFNRACLEDPSLSIQDYCEEHSFTLPITHTDLAAINAILVSLDVKPMTYAHIGSLIEENSFIEHYRIDKLRTSYMHGLFTVSIDEVAHLGTFLEIELMAKSTENLMQIKKDMESILLNLSLRALKTGYGTLLLRKTNFEHYLLGRFILEEDKKYRDLLYKQRS